MIIFDNIIFSLQKAGGVSLVWFEFIKRMIDSNIDDLFFLEYNKCLDDIFRNNLYISRDNIFFNSSFNPKLISLFNSYKQFGHKFIFHSSYYRVSKSNNAINITTVHDFIDEKSHFNIKKYLRIRQKHYAIMKSNYIICISENTKKDLLEIFPFVDSNKIIVIYNGVSDEYYPMTYVDDNELPFPPFSYVLFVGTRVGYKNFEFAVEAIKNTNKKMIIVGPKITDEEIRYLNSELGLGRYKSFEKVLSSKLNIFYNRAYCLLYPSSYEGFGIPVIEAQKAGCPVIAYNSSSIPEIIGDTPLLLDVLSEEAVQNAFLLIDDFTVRDHIIENGILNAKRFSWEKMYYEILDLYKEALEKYC